MPRVRLDRASRNDPPINLDVWPDALLFEELERGLAIDEHALDAASLQHSDLFYRVSKGLTKYSNLRDEAKAAVADIESDTDLAVRASVPEGQRTTEREIANLVAQEPRVKTARKRLAELSAIVSKYASLKEAYMQRSYALRGLIDLYTAGYFGDPAQHSRDMRTERSERARASQREQRGR